MHNFLAATRRCATCQWWEGERIADRERGRVQAPRDAAAGRCRSPVGWWRGRIRQGESLCAGWLPWEVLRGASAGRARAGLVMLGPPMAYPQLPKVPPT